MIPGDHKLYNLQEHLSPLKSSLPQRRRFRRDFCCRRIRCVFYYSIKGAAAHILIIIKGDKIKHLFNPLFPRVREIDISISFI